MARAARGTTWTALSYIVTQGMRLVSNLILTRLLFPEAFGVMALVSVFLVGLAMFSDVGVAPAIMQSKRGDDPAFLDTAWTIQLLRGAGLWITACVIAWPVSLFYDQPLLAQLLPVAGVSLLIAGFEPTRIDTANRHLLLGRVTVLDLCAQIIGIIAMLSFAAALQSVWALALGWVVGALARLFLMLAFLPGHRNRPRWEPAAASELIRFGVWIFLSTACGFLVAQGDKAILGKYLTMQGLGIYNIGYFLASFPLLLGQAVTGKVLIPLYREHPVGDAAQTARDRLHRLRFGLTGLLMVALAVLAFLGPWIVGVLYDQRYVAAGGILVAIGLVQMIQVVTLTYDQSALAAGDSRNYFLLTAAKAVIQTTCFLIGAHFAGLLGALCGLGVAAVLIYPLVVLLARRHHAWDHRHDALFLVTAFCLGAFAVWINFDAIAALSPTAGRGLH